MGTISCQMLKIDLIVLTNCKLKILQEQENITSQISVYDN
jgi:hypothetical protein